MALNMTAELRSNFFDRKKVQNKIGKANASALNRAGGRIRKSGQRNIRRRKKKSKPGQGPTAWLSVQAPNAALRKIVYAFNPDGWGVIIGPVRLNQKQNPPAPKLLEHGGKAFMPALYIVRFDDGTVHHYGRFPEHLGYRTDVQFFPRQATSRKGRPNYELMLYRKRPFMEPALMKNLKHIPLMWRNTLGRSA